MSLFSLLTVYRIIIILLFNIVFFYKDMEISPSVYKATKGMHIWDMCFNVYFHRPILSLLAVCG